MEEYGCYVVAWAGYAGDDAIGWYCNENGDVLGTEYF